MSIPILKTSFRPSDDTIAQTDIVMLLTPRIIRTHEYTARDLSPIYVGTNQNFGLTGPPPLIAAPPSSQTRRPRRSRRACARRLHPHGPPGRPRAAPRCRRTGAVPTRRPQPPGQADDRRQSQAAAADAT